VIFSATEADAQRKDFKYKFISKLISADSTGAVIGRAHIINTTQKLGTVSDEYGTFTVTANVGDSIMFSAIGYEKLIIAAHDTMYTNTRVVRLKPVAYELDEVNIGILSTYDRFKQDILGKDTEDNSYGVDPFISKYEVYIPPLPNQGGINIPFAVSPVTFLYNLLSTEGKQHRYYLSIINETAEHVIIGKKFNGLIVHQLTGLKDDELIKFMSYCNFPKEYLLQASEGEINRAVMRIYREYIKNER
jgi:hypothetical protein